MMNADSASLKQEDPTLAQRLVSRVEELIRAAESATHPLENEPYRGQLFELFVTAQAAGYLDEDGPQDLSAEGLCHQLSERWGLKQAAQQSVSDSSGFAPAQLKAMRSLWSVMRMWMEWDYAWSRWEEFHPRGGPVTSQPATAGSADG